MGLTRHLKHVTFNYITGIISTLHVVEVNLVDEDSKVCTAQTTEAPLKYTTTDSSNQTTPNYTNVVNNTHDSFTVPRTIKIEPVSVSHCTVLFQNCMMHSIK